MGIGAPAPVDSNPHDRRFGESGGEPGRERTGERGAEYILFLSDGRWTNLLFALPGAGGAPRLRGQGPLLAGTPLALQVQDGLPAAPAVLVIGLDWLGAPFKGGVLVPDFGPPGALLPLALDGAGALSLQGVWPPGIPGSLSLYLQAWLTDASAPAGLAATNGLSATAP